MLSKKLILGLLLVLAVLSGGCVLSPSVGPFGSAQDKLRTGLSKGCVCSVIEKDNVQERLDTAAPVIAGSQTVGQTFVSHYPRLSAVELPRNRISTGFLNIFMTSNTNFLVSGVS